MPDAADRIAAKLDAMEARIKALETAPRVNNTSVHGGATRWYLDDESLAPRLHVGDGGAFSGAAGNGVGVYVRTEDTPIADMYMITNLGEPDFLVQNEDHTAMAQRIVSGKFTAPLISCAWQSDHAHAVDTFGRPIITAGAYERVWAAYLPVCTGAFIGDIYVNIGTGITSADVRIMATMTSDSGGRANGGTQTVYEQTGITASAWLGGEPYTIPDAVVSPAGSPVGTLVRLELEGRVTGGAGNLAIAPTRPVANWAT